MRLADFLYYIVNEEGKPLTGYPNEYRVLECDINTLKDARGKSAFLDYSPDGWRDVLVKFARSIKYRGLFRDFTVPLVFVKDGAYILKEAFWREGYEAYRKLVIQKADRTQFPIKHKDWYYGELDLSQFEQERAKVKCNVMEGGLVKIFKANESTTYEIPVEELRVKMDGFFLDGTFNFIIPDVVQMVSPVLNTHLLPLSFTTGEGTQISIAHTNGYLEYQETVPDYEDFSKDWFIKAYDDIQIRIKGRILASTDVSDRYALFLRTSAGRRLSIPYTTSEYDPLRTLTYLNFDETFDIDANENVFFEGEVTGGPATVTLENGEFSIFYKNRFKTTYIKAVRPFTLLNELVKKMTDGKYQAKSDFLTRLESHVLTSGDAIRGFENSVIKTSITDFFKSFDSIFSCGLGIEKERLTIEDIAYFFKPTESYDLGIIDEISINVATELCFNDIKVGYGEEEYNDVNGRFEFNQGQNYKPPGEKINKELDLISKYRADPFGIEFTRINFQGKTTTDSSSDNDTFILNIETYLNNDENGQYYNLNRPAVTITGVPDPVNIFNVLLSPKRNLLNNGRLIRSILDLQDDKLVKFQTCDKNRELVVDGLAEKDNVIVGQLGEKLFLPYYISFTAAAPINFQEALQENPYETLSFTYKGTKYYGWLFDGGIQPATNDKQKLKLLASPKNDHTKFIQI